MRPLLLRIAAAAACSLIVTACVVVENRTEGPAPAPGAPGEPAPKASPAPLAASSDRALLGSLGWALLSPDVPRAVVEIDQLGGVTLSQVAVEAVERALRQHGGKQEVEVIVTDVEASASPASAQELLTASEDHRDHRSGSGTVALHVLVLPGSFAGHPVPGVAFLATAMALFPEAVRDRLPPGADVGAFEAAVAVHELGHTFGLVNRTGVGEFHEDPERPGHSANEQSVMHWAVESQSITEVFRSGPPSDFDEDDRREMERVREQGRSR